MGILFSLFEEPDVGETNINKTNVINIKLPHLKINNTNSKKQFEETLNKNAAQI